MHLQYLKKILYKWNCAVQSPVVQEVNCNCLQAKPQSITLEEGMGRNIELEILIRTHNNDKCLYCERMI